MRFPWPEIRTKYETGNYSMRQLAEEYGFSENGGYKRKLKEGWQKRMLDPEVQQEAKRKVIEQEADKEAQLRSEYGRILEALRNGTATELFVNDTDFNRLKQLKIASEIFGNTKKLEWEIYGILDNIGEGGDDNIAELAEALRESARVWSNE